MRISAQRQGWIDRRGPPGSARRRRLHIDAALVALVVGAGFGAGCEREPAGEPDRPNVLLISLDTVRADHLDIYGYERPTSPNLARFAERATLYERAHTTAPWTLPAHASLFTGLYPPEHGSQMVRRAPDARPHAALPLAAELTTLAEVFQAAGYRTAGVAANFLYFASRYQLDQGFGHSEVLPGKTGSSVAPALLVNERAIMWLRSEGTNGSEKRPFFLFLNYMDAHAPYNTTSPRGFIEGAVPDFSLEDHRATEALVVGSDDPIPQERIQVVIDQYDLGIASADEGVGALFAALSEMGLFDDTLIVVTSDHGEFLGEHRLLGHAKDVYEGTMWVPLLIKEPAQRTGRVDSRSISLVHVARLVLATVGLEHLAPDGAFPHRWPERASFAENRYSLWVDMAQPWGSRFDRIREVLYRDEFKYIHSSDGRHELYDLARDPSEASNLLDASPELGPAWIDRIAVARPAADPDRSRADPTEMKPLSQEELEQLRALGYVE